MEKGKQVITNECNEFNEPEHMTYGLESLFPGVISSEYGTISGISSFGLLGPVNFELSGSLDSTVSELPPGLANSKYNNSLPVPANYGLPVSANYVSPGPANYGSPGPANYGSPSPANYSNLLGSENFEVDSNLPGSKSSGFGNNANDDDSQIIQDDTNELTLRVGKTFTDWESVQCIVDAYSKWHSFVAIKSRKDLDPAYRSII
ncbi:hypothetical protein C2G38_2162213 [Gigaspora rosea]|uniref:Uncharacterized protein n=1 Tax=Gigaspora rosea TaxID=44941 RepID=A0A397VZS4_9GLOM|nr:hypothetical protein C2G38_2162213 [Gigaspora rosea]